MLGSSETGGIAVRRQERDPAVGWRPLPGVEVRAENGRLAVRSAHLPDTSWFSTADLAVFASNGSFTLTGRADRIVKVEGKRVSLAAVEQALAASPLVNEARVLPLPALRERLGAVITLTAEGERSLARDGSRAVTIALRKALSGVVERVAVPRRWRFVPEIPVNTQGKSTVSALAALFAETDPRLPLATVTHRAEAHVELMLRIPPDLVYFDGHFPGAPILPGIAQIDWVLHYGREYFGADVAFTRLEGVKFHRPIRPGDVVRLDLSWRAHPRSIGFVFESTATRHASGRILFEAR